MQIALWVWDAPRSEWYADRMRVGNEAQARTRASDLRLAGHEVRTGFFEIGPPEGPPFAVTKAAHMSRISVATEEAGDHLDEIERLRKRIEELEVALSEALAGWQYSAQYQEQMPPTHADHLARNIARVKRVLGV